MVNSCTVNCYVFMLKTTYVIPLLKSATIIYVCKSCTTRKCVVLNLLNTCRNCYSLKALTISKCITAKKCYAFGKNQNAPNAIDSNLLGSDMLVRLLQPLNALLSIIVTVSGILTSARLVQPTKVEGFILCTP